MQKHLLSIVACVVLTSCVGSGVDVYEVSENEYILSVRSNHLPYKDFEYVRKHWELEKEKLCGDLTPKEKDVREYGGSANPHLGELKHYDTYKQGTVICVEGD